MTTTKERWEASSPDVTWEANHYYLDGTDWPDWVEVRAWQRNSEGERRIVASRRYRLEELA